MSQESNMIVRTKNAYKYNMSIFYRIILPILALFIFGTFIYLLFNTPMTTNMNSIRNFSQA
jgi:hypothetical protein